VNTPTFLHDILLLFLSLSQQNQPEIITRLFTEAMNSLVPDLGFAFAKEFPDPQVFYYERVFTQHNQFGWITAGDQYQYQTEAQKTIIRNTVRMLAIILEHATQRKELQKTNRELAEALKHQETFLANMSHELRTPLAAILGNAELLRMQPQIAENPKQTRYIGTIEESGNHLLELINDILNYSKIDANQFSLHKEKIQLEPICQQSILYVKAAAEKKHINVEYRNDIPEQLIIADPLRIKQVLLNLLNNAAKFTPAGGQLGLKVSKLSSNSSIVLEVWDTGIGISPEDQKKIFHPFVQIDHRLERKFEGTGLGLAISKRLIEMHGGTLSITSEINTGSSLKFVLPI